MRFAKASGAVLAALAFGGAAGWAAHTTWAETDAAGPEPPPPYVVYRSSLGEVSRTLNYNVETQWTAAETVTAEVTGRLTQIELEPGEVVEEGGVIASIDLRPLVAATGTIPAFRDLSFGTSGVDVAQLQDFLVRQGWAISDESGKFGRATRTAVRSWQRRLGIPDDGVVRAGDIVYVAGLPAVLTSSPDLHVGDHVQRETPLAVRWQTPPRLTVSLDAQQASQIPDGTGVVIEVPDGTIAATAGARSVDPESGVVSVSIALDDDGYCASGCSAFVPGISSLLPSTFAVVPATKGVVVPVAAIAASATQEQVVTTLSGERRRVSIVAAASGMAVVEGLETGVDLRVATDG